MVTNIIPWLINLFLGICCAILLLSLLTIQDMNKSLVGDKEYCTTQLEMKFSDMRLKNQQMASLAARVNNLTEERVLILEKMDNLQEELTKMEKGVGLNVILK